MSSETMQIEKHLRNIEREFAQVKTLMGAFARQRITALREELVNEGFDEGLVELVGSVPVWEEDYKNDIRRVICEEHL